jgi:hypothetical protein
MAVKTVRLVARREVPSAKSSKKIAAKKYLVPDDSPYEEKASHTVN